ncbi:MULTISPECIES: hypothetical protein [Bacillus cereus group]|uniref:hypothetical protein n=1 Tax=Bacillus cereus group TaxID=86661 RepID=UPI0008FE4551|nr:MULTISPECIES: hypothetical protein [Bacillus cereus group]MDG1621960.1 hypothetical protein [Bacillus mobilis]MDX5837242.1 hypothetical protein [Bacillus cereus group sp. BfR-BA-01700]OJE31256.1 hypothetical protein BAQ44_22715 [Bacillus mobilis]HDR7243323.1 hypothetical protein [Bacillus mobilis]
MYPIHRDLDYQNQLKLSNDFRYDFLHINYSDTLLTEYVFVFRTNIVEGNEEKGNIFVDILEKSSIDVVSGIKHNNTFVHCLSDTNFEESRKKINESIELVRYDNEISYEICVSFKNQRYYHNVTKELCELNEIQYVLFEKYNNKLVNNTFLEVKSIFMKQLDILRNKKTYENFSIIEQCSIKRSYETQEAIHKEKKYYYSKYRQAELDWSMLLHQFRYLPSKDMKILKYKPNLLK